MIPRATAHRISPFAGAPADAGTARPALPHPLTAGGRALETVATAWRELEVAATSPTQHLIWSQSCAESFHDSRTPRTVVVRERGRAIAIAPLVTGAGPIPRLEALGVRELFEPMDFLYADAAALAQLADRLARQPLPLLLQRVPAQSPLVDALERAFQGRGVVHAAPISPCPFIDLDASWADPETHFNSGRRSDFRRARRHAEQLGPVTFEIQSPAPDEVGALIEEALAVEALSWKGTEGTALARDPVRARFFHRYAVAAAAQGILRLVFMRIAGRAVGMQIAVECHGRFWLLKIGYDEKVARCSPGNLLMLHSVQYAAARGLASYEFLGGAAPWTATWTKTLRTCTVVRAYPFSATGMAALSWDTGRWMVARLKRRLQERENRRPQERENPA
jgi:CelD/BcsL family acetyltransferase involved in cellulose biosynthesis